MLCLARLLLLCALLGGVHGSAPASANRVTIGAEDDWYPYSGVIAGEVKGLGVDLVRAAFAERGVTVQFVGLPYKRCLELTRRGELLACAQPARNAETQDHFLWPEQPLLHAVSRIYARAPSPDRELSARDLEGQTVLVTNGFDYGHEFDANHQIRRLTAAKEISVFRMLLARRADYAIAYEKTAEHVLEQIPEPARREVVAVGVIARVPQYLVFSRLHPEGERMLAVFNQGFRLMRANGEVQRIERKWKAGGAHRATR